MESLVQRSTQAVLECQQLFWQALQHQDAQLFMQLLAEDFVCRSHNHPDQPRATFIQTITTMPARVLSLTAERVTVDLFGAVAVLTGVQVAQLALPDGRTAEERLALTNIYRCIDGQWQLVLAHPVPVSNAPAS